MPESTPSTASATVSTVHIDGASRGNPGQAAYAFVLRRPGHPDLEESNTLGATTNNIAEYTALVRALARAAELGVRELAVFSDSELLVKQMNGLYKVKNADLKELYTEAKSLQNRFQSLTITHVRRELNKDADRLCNEALDGRARGASPEITTASTASPAPGRSPAPPSRNTPRRFAETPPEQLEMEALALLNAVEKSWRSGSTTPTVHELWERLWILLREHGQG